MTDPTSTIPEHAKPELWRRYENWRVRRYEKHLVKNAHRWPRLRNRRAYRRLVVALIVAQAVFVTSAIVGFFTLGWLFIPFVIGLGGSCAILFVLRAVTGSVADAPIGALDEIQLAQRNSARSLGFIVIFSLAFIPYFVLIFMGSAMTMVKGQNVYGAGLLLIAVVFVGACVPTMLTSWWMADPDPDDFDPDAFDPDGARATAPSTSSAPTAQPPTPPAPTEPAHRDLEPPAPAPW